MALSAHNRELAKRNMHHHHLGPGGYYRKEAGFRKIEEEAAESEVYNLKGVSKRAKHWILGRNLEASNALKFNNPETEQAVSKILKYGEEKLQGSFKPSRERDDLSLALGNPEYTGRVKGIGKRTTWKYGFEEDRDMYKNMA